MGEIEPTNRASDRANSKRRPTVRGKRGSTFIRGLKLNDLYYRRIIAPILTRELPELKHSAGLIGTGSEVLGYDDPQSMDHNWGLRLSIFLSQDEIKSKGPIIDAILRRSLPHTFLGYPTSFGKPDKRGVRLPDPKRRRGEVNHYIDVLTIQSFFQRTIGVDPYAKIQPRAWLILPQQKLLEVTSGKLFHDDLGIEALVQKFRYYPRNIWLYMLASQWSRISEEESFVARTSSVGDEIGSRIISSRIVNEVMGLAFLMERQYAPYSKWFGKAFSRLNIAKKLGPVLARILDADGIVERERWLTNAYHIVAMTHNQLGITRKSIKTHVSNYFQRPYMIIHADKIAQEIRGEIRNKNIRSLPLMGSFDQLTGGSDILTNQERLKRFRNVYQPSKN